MSPSQSKHPGRPITMSGPLGDLARAMGGLKALGRAIHASPRTIRAWAAKGRIPFGPAEMLIAALCRNHNIQPLGRVQK